MQGQAGLQKKWVKKKQKTARFYGVYDNMRLQYTLSGTTPYVKQANLSIYTADFMKAKTLDLDLGL